MIVVRNEYSKYFSFIIPVNRLNYNSSIIKYTRIYYFFQILFYQRTCFFYDKKFRARNSKCVEESPPLFSIRDENVRRTPSAAIGSEAAFERCSYYYCVKETY